ncbi:MAG: DUF5717 family protein [Bacteroidales bacterium]|nr:DUF5717 family protein [Clostridium sp.]MCM1204334.1 DUF5717 family protein [Bacteroidales bacterium]
MKSKVEQYAKGDFYVEYPEIKLSKSYLQLKIEAGSVYTGSILVTSVNDIPMKMMVYDDAYLLRLNDHSLVGRKGEISFTFDGTGKKRGSTFDGAIHIIGNGMEKVISYNIEIIAPFIDVNGVALEDLMKFSALAERDWNKALQIFYSDEFALTLLEGHDDYLAAYKSLKDSLDRRQALEEFLVFIHKKRALTLQVEHDRFQFNFPKMREEHQLILRKNTWGYCRMKVRTDVRFIAMHQSEICSMDFSGDNCILNYTLDPEMLDEQEPAVGHIILENTYQKIVVSVLIKKPEEGSRILTNHKSDRKLKKLEMAALTHNYLDYRIGLLPLSAFVEKTRQGLYNLITFEPEAGVYKLGLLHMSLLSGQEENVRQEILRMEADRDKTMEGAKEHCYYLYLKALLSKEARQIVHACEEIEKALAREKDKLFYFWLLIYLDERYQKDKQWLFSQIEGLFLGGYESPVLALEICDLLNQEPLLLKKLCPLELAAVRFGLRNHYLSKEAQEEFLQLAAREKSFSPQVFSLLAVIYDVEKKPDVIRIMCSLLIKGGRLEHRYHQYYLEGIRCGYKIVGIQENYLRSMDREQYELIPDSVLRYFNYKSILTDSEYAYLYANVIINKRQYLGQYEEYLPNIMAFMEGQIVKGNISDDLSVIYSELLRPQAVNAYYAGSLVNVIFKRKLTVVNENITAVVVSHKELEEETVVPIVKHAAYVDMITESAVISLVDKEGNRFISTIPYKLQKLVDESAYMDILGQYAGDDFRYALYRYGLAEAYDAKDAGEVNIARGILAFHEISRETKQQAVYGIVRYYNEHFDMDILSSYLKRVEMEYVPPKNAAEFMNNLILCGLYDKAYEAVKRFGYQGISADNLVRLVEKIKEFSEYAKEETLIAMAVYLYRMGQETVDILSYLVDYYQSGLKDMLRLWKRANEKLARLDLLEENILCLTLYTEQWDGDVFKVFASYSKKKRWGMVIKAFMKRASFACLIEEEEVPEAFFDMLYRQIEAGELPDDMCRAAGLLFLSQKAKLEEKEISWIKGQVEYFIKRGILLPFFRSFKKYLKLPKDLFLLTYVVTRDKAGRQISFRYGIQSGVEKPECSRTARMMEILPGYYMKEFVLFHGENLLYEMPEENAGSTRVYESMGMKAKGETEEYENRFEMLNSMLLNQEVGENQVLVDKIDWYLKLAAIVEENLELVD